MKKKKETFSCSSAIISKIKYVIRKNYLLEIQKRKKDLIVELRKYKLKLHAEFQAEFFKNVNTQIHCNTYVEQQRGKF